MLLQKRITLQKWFTLSACKLVYLLEPPSATAVQVAVDDYIKFTDEREVFQGKIADRTLASSLIDEVEVAFEFIEKYKPVYVQVMRFLETQNKMTSSLLTRLIMQSHSLIHLCLRQL